MSRKQIYRVIFFDAGGTLIRQEPSLICTLMSFFEARNVFLTIDEAEAIVQHCRKWAEEQSARELNGSPRMPHKIFLRRMYNAGLKTAAVSSPDQDIWEITDNYLSFAESRRTWKAVPEAHKTLTTLIDHGYRLGLISNFNESLPSILHNQNLLDYFDAVVVSELVGVEKPDPEIMRIACREAKIQPGESLYVGDQPVDLLCAKKAGMSAAWICDEGKTLPDSVPYDPDYRIGSIKDVLQIAGI
jgi:putative hydrolase of the HAD superfamily